MDWRNPFEDFRDKYLSFKNVKAYKLCAIRFGCVKYDPAKVDEYKATIKRVLGNTVTPAQMEFFGIAYRDMGVKWGIQPWITKYLNAKFAFVLGVSLAGGWFPLLHFGLSFHTSAENYWQIGGGFGAEGTVTDGNRYERTVICGKFRKGNFKKEWEDGGNYDVYGYYEGVI